MSCQNCKGERVANVTAKSSDLSHVSLGECERNGYLPDDMGIGGGDYIEFSYCLACGQIQGQWPLEETDLEAAPSGERG
jgi:hypothetical protein